MVDIIKSLLQDQSGMRPLRSFLETDEIIAPSILLSAIGHDLKNLACGIPFEFMLNDHYSRAKWKLFGAKAG